MLSLQLYEQIFNKHYSRLRYYGWKIVKVTEDSEDTVIEAFEELYKRLADIPDEAHAIRFLKVCVHNKAVNKAKYRANKRIEELNDDEYNLVESIEIESNLIEMVYKSMESLPPERRKIFNLLFIKGKKLAEVADELHLSINTVKSQRKKAIDSIRLHLGY